MQETTRIELARHRLRIARRVIGVAAAAGLVAFALAARASHPGSHASSSATSSTSSSSSAEPATEADDGYGFDFGQSSIAPSTGGAGAVQSGGS